MTEIDTALVKRAQAGDKHAFHALLQEVYDIMFRMAYKYCGNRADAEDITQTACIKLAKNLAGFRHDAKFTSWLYRLVINTAIDEARKTKREVILSGEEGFIGIGHDRTEQKIEAREILQQVLNLPEKEKTALLLVYSEGLTHAEAAKVMDCKESTVSWYIHEARKKLKDFENKEADNG